MRELQRQGNQRIKKEVLKHYSNNSFQCSNCGYDIFNGLVIDHAYGGGARHRKEIGIRGGSGFYHWLINNKFPQGFQVLCHDCYFLKSSYPEDYIKIGEKYRELKS